MVMLDPHIRTFDFDLICDGCGDLIKAGDMVVYFPTRPKDNKFFCSKDDCGAEELRIFILDLDYPSFV